MSISPNFSTRHEQHFGDRVVRCYRERPASVLDSFLASVERAPDADCIVCEGQRLSYREVADRAETMAAQLRHRGVEPGDRVGLLIGNGIEFVLTVIGILRAGAIIMPLNIREQAPGLRYMLEHSDARAVVFAADQGGKLPPPTELPGLRHRFVINGDNEHSEPFENLLQTADMGLPLPSVNEEDPAVILYTSGTTGTPKGVILTHFNIIHSVMHFQHTMGLGDGERTLLVAPGSHVTGLVANIFTMTHVAGCTVVIPAFDAVEAVRLIAREKVTHTIMVPAMYNLCLMRTNFRDHDLSAFRIGGFGGAPMPESTIARLREQLPDLELINAYGATETTSPSTCLPLGDAGNHADSVGRVVPCGDVRIMDDHGREVAPGQSGELWISGPMVVPGYWNNPEANAREFTAGHWRSGDIGSIDEEGFVRVFDRKKDMINRGGYNIYSVELENLITGHPAVVESAVIPHPDEVLGEKIHVFVTVVKGQELTENEIRQFCRENLADYKTPDYVTIQEDPLPRNANGKLVKAGLKERIAR
ncbi:Acyl-CoA synthetase (AMP-forming)/AMP-acid ligase II [Marinobacter daqiaonensis]|uniref:Acyl-CoA synthetase (AMP-forming)/AMP-acid ligase II n=1 Tax=Marinobacter daqiaonensis TaxID=650891 RepID=A0A1I6IMP0_9GAMM|nr:class I adenylate-forming enzyme family protein [Marinobacter daqiaonensis]SFR67986.1 Acyl-CoA synthetase (AMP-forming)/AMP-acid ligase II [Marinobacter daqiaonensis]